MIIHNQVNAYDSPWTKKQRIKMFLWEYTWLFFCSWTPKPANRFRIFIVKLFGANIYGQPFIHQRARIQIPWNLTMHDKSAIGDRANIYTLGEIEICANATVGQEVYLSTGTHDFNSNIMNLITDKIYIGRNAFLGARAFIMPGVKIGENAIVGACSVVTKDVDVDSVVVGNPARFIRKRTIKY